MLKSDLHKLCKMNDVIFINGITHVIMIINIILITYGLTPLTRHIFHLIQIKVHFIRHGALGGSHAPVFKSSHTPMAIYIVILIS